ncbi:MAG: ribosomal protein L7/L12 [Bacteroidaceae bacterium]|nr:ribosomal protein L7/L12 [Bacteroidaceae bacterium]
MGFLDFLFGKSEKQPKKVLCSDELEAINTPGEYSVKLVNRGAAVLQVCKCLNDLVTHDLKASKYMCDTAPCIVKEGMSERGAKIIKDELEALGATVTIEKRM